MKLFRRQGGKADKAVLSAYSTVVAEARQKRFYAELGVPDSLTGRFDMICLQMALVLRRLRGQGPEADVFSQALFDLFFGDMDRSLREMGVGDISVPKRISKMGSAFYGLLAALTEALADESDDGLAEVMVGNIYSEGGSEHAATLARELRQSALFLESQPVEAIIAGKIELGLMHVD